MKSSQIIGLFLIPCFLGCTEMTERERAEYEKSLNEDSGEEVDWLEEFEDYDYSEPELENIAYEPIGEFSEGNRSGQKYTNEHFGFELTLPTDWSFVELPEQNARLETNKINFTNKNSELGEKFDKSIPNLIPLFSIKKSETGPFINVFAESLDAIPKVDDALEYLEYTDHFITKTYKDGYPQYSDEYKSIDHVGTRDFLTQYFEIETENDVYDQLTYTAQFDNFLLNFVCTFSDVDEDHEIAFLLVESIEWPVDREKDPNQYYVDKVDLIAEEVFLMSMGDTKEYEFPDEYWESVEYDNIEYISISWNLRGVDVYEEFVLQGNQLIYAYEEVDRSAIEEDDIWWCSYTIRDRTIVSYTTHGEGESDRKGWSPESILEQWDQKTDRLQTFQILRE